MVPGKGWAIKRERGYYPLGLKNIESRGRRQVARGVQIFSKGADIHNLIE